VATVLTLPIREVLAATPRAKVLRVDLDGHPFEYAAGQAVMIASHGHEPRRPYSISASPDEAQRWSAIELLVGVDSTGSPGPHLSLEPGARVDIEGPIGTFTFPSNPAERCFVFIAGGTGIAPLRAMLKQALSIPHRHIGVFYSARTPDEFAYEHELRALADGGEIELRQTVTRSTDDEWTGSRGRFDRAVLGQLVHEPETLCFVCGPPTFVDEMAKLVEDIGIARMRIRVEEWT